MAVLSHILVLRKLKFGLRQVKTRHWLTLDEGSEKVPARS